MDNFCQQLNAVLYAEFFAGRQAAKQMEGCYLFARWAFGVDFEAEIARLRRLIEIFAAKRSLSILAAARQIEAEAKAEAKAAGVLDFSTWVMLQAAAYSLIRPMFEN